MSAGRVKQEQENGADSSEPADGMRVEVQYVEELGDMDEEEEAESRIRLPVPFLVCGQDDLSPAQSIFSAFYKCHGFPHDCWFYSNDFDEMRDHLMQNHEADHVHRCFYCDRHKPGSADALLDHLIRDHCNVRFQCNLCLYRACRDIHVLNHHVTCHYEEFEATCPDAEASIKESLSWARG